MRRVVLFVIVSALATVSHAASNEWRLMPIRTEGQYNRGEAGSETLQWMQGAARSKANPNKVYISHDCSQIWRSDDGGQTWVKPLNIGLYVNNGNSIEVDPVNFSLAIVIESPSYDYRHENYGGIYRTTDGGNNWTFVQQGPTLKAASRRYEHNVAWAPSSVDSSGATVWYAALYAAAGDSFQSGSAIYRSSDRGVTWTKKGSLTTYSAIYEIQVSPLDANTILIATSSGLRRSTDGGTTISYYGNLPSGEVTSVAYSPTNAKYVYAVVYGNGTYKSTDGGTSFTKMSSEDSYYLSVLNDARRIAMSPSMGNVFYVIPQNVSGGKTAIRTDNAGSSWVKTSISLPPDVAAWRGGGVQHFYGSFSWILPSATDSSAVGQTGGWAFLYRATDGMSFVDGSMTLNALHCGGTNYQIAWDESNPQRFIASFADTGTWLTENNTNWFEKRSFPSGWPGGTYTSMASAIHPTQPNTWVATNGNGFVQRLNRTTNAGVDWRQIDIVEKYTWRVWFHPTNPDYVYAQDRRSTNGGVSFSTMSALGGAILMDYCPSNPDMIYAVDSGNGIVKRSLDKGDSWSTYVDVGWAFNPFDPRPVFAVDPSNCNAFYTVDASGDLTYYNGSTWTSKGLLSMVSRPAGYWVAIRSVNIDPSHPEVRYATLYGHGVFPLIFRSTDSGATWQDITYNHFSQGQSGININPHSGEVMLGGCSGTWVLPPPYPSTNGIYDKLLPSKVTPEVNPKPNPPENLNISRHITSQEMGIVLGVS